MSTTNICYNSELVAGFLNVRPHNIWKVNKVKIGQAPKLALTFLLLFQVVSIVIAPAGHYYQITSFGTIVYETLPLHVEGRLLKDPFNNTVYLRGIAKPRFAEDPTGCWAMSGEVGDGAGWMNWRSAAVAANLDAMLEWGANVVRINTCVEYWKFDVDNHRQHIKDLAQMCSERGMYLIYCAWNIQGGDSQFISGILPYPPHHSRTHIIANEQEFVDYWVSVAEELKDYPNVIFEIWNEAGGEMQSSVSERDHYFDVVVDVIIGIRNVTDHLCLAQWGYGAGPSFNLQVWLEDLKNDWIDASNLTNVAYVTHLYDDMYGGSGSSYEQVKARLQSDKIEWAVATLQVPLIITETSADVRYGYEQAWSNALTILNEWNISYTGWWWRQNAYALLQDDQPWIPGPTLIGQILIDSIAAGQD